MDLVDETTTTAASRLGADTVAILPVGGVEQHGPALPLGTDFFTANGVAARVDRDDVVVLPGIPVGVSDHHLQFDGTLTVGPATLESYVSDVLTSVAAHDVEKAVIVNGHGGNTDALRRVARELRAEESLFAVPWNWWDGLDDLIDERLETTLGHADAVETSVLLYLTALVREDELSAAEAGAADSWGKSIAGADVGFDTIDFSESGVVGEPTEGTEALGAEFVTAATEDLNTFIDWLQRQSIEELWRKPHR